MLEKLGVKQSKCVIYCDNSSAIKLSKNPILHGRSKHIDVRFHFLRNLANDGVIELIHWHKRSTGWHHDKAPEVGRVLEAEK